MASYEDFRPSVLTVIGDLKIVRAGLVARRGRPRTEGIVVPVLGRRALRRLLVPVGVALALAGCGQDESAYSSGFVEEYGAVTDRYSSHLEQAKVQGRAASGGGVEAVLAVYGEIRDVTRAAAQEYEALSAPDRAQEQFARLSDAVGAQADALDDVLTAAGDGDAAATQAALTAYARALSDWGAARQELEDVIEQDPARAGPD